jgi:hypothetical protein
MDSPAEGKISSSSKNQSKFCDTLETNSPPPQQSHTIRKRSRSLHNSNNTTCKLEPKSPNHEKGRAKRSSKVKTKPQKCFGSVQSLRSQPQKVSKEEDVDCLNMNPSQSKESAFVQDESDLDVKIMEYNEYLQKKISLQEHILAIIEGNEEYFTTEVSIKEANKMKTSLNKEGSKVLELVKEKPKWENSCQSAIRHFKKKIRKIAELENCFSECELQKLKELGENSFEYLFILHALRNISALRAGIDVSRYNWETGQHMFKDKTIQISFRLF